MNIGSRIKLFREAANISQEQLGRYLCVDQSTIAKIENGERNINTESIDKLANLFCVKAYDLLYAEEVIPKFQIAFRAQKVDEDDFEAIAAFNKIVLNCEFIEEVQERRAHDQT